MTTMMMMSGMTEPFLVLKCSSTAAVSCPTNFNFQGLKPYFFPFSSSKVVISD